MPAYGFHASHEQFRPSELLRLAVAAEQAGFDRAMCSDHFAPFGPEQGESGFAWSWLGAALARTDLPFGVVNAPGQRYHPALVAQAAATLAEMFPGRFWLAVGSGQALNEHVTGERWPSKPERNTRLRECVEVIRALFAGECVSHRGLVTVDRAVLWTRPVEPPPVYAAAVTPATAGWAASWADGLITVNQPVPKVREVIEAYRGAGGGGPVLLQVHVSWAADEPAALRQAHEQWRTAILGSDAGWDLALPDDLAVATAHVRPEDMREHVLISSDPGRHAQWLHEYAELGVDECYLHQVGRDQDAFLDTFSTHVLPELR
ncbi:TIGR03885 family FMN-dependent LLM class oxidoreductase [Micromonospora radicis]|uniref:TIGR03557 family F420-dependent LLM class oxidoreductase n=1 Tax=Micromonospora radicis TaxID=1894971 RepID=A0A418MSL5_9ACTN|nr:TIGR03885 family FMN-dependent LLM class oxidoreductase [Micromonospora radicis]RIV37066.1 TIGR03557 family F420-dependent LLM class oxidoreductase [Micromonospora radicis]